MTTNPNPQAVAFSEWESPKLEITMTPPTNITGWTLQLNIRTEDGTIVLQMTPPSTIDDVVNGIFGFILTSAQAGGMQVGDYKYDVWRIDAGFEKRLTWGTLTVLQEQWK